ncbi:unnamed protein product [Gongylonema pulchrum]|uniref:Inositol-3-phosphate synthase n=1 Tax=Gongylonema pulchrum TaxID=637853 RepID=A0A183D7S5_9BILA|nr:unnamed protein product [Gongylonema pulchrum]
MVCDVLQAMKTSVGGLNIFLAANYDWIVKQAVPPDDYVAFIKSFAGVLFKLYVKQYESEHKNEIVFDEKEDKVKKGYSYVEMPTIVLITVPKASCVVSFSDVSSEANGVSLPRHRSSPLRSVACGAGMIEPAAEAKCCVFNDAVKDLAQKWKTSMRKLVVS